MRVKNTLVREGRNLREKRPSVEISEGKVSDEALAS